MQAYRDPVGHPKKNENWAEHAERIRVAFHETVSLIITLQDL